MAGKYTDLHHQAITNPDRFWAKVAEDIHWDKKWDKVLDDINVPIYRWFTGGELNTCFNAVDIHVNSGRADQLALIYESPITGNKKSYTYFDLLQHVSRCAGLLADLGVNKGDRVIIYMPMIPEAVFAMLACARLGAVHSVVFGGFAANELALRIDDARPKLIISASCGIEPGRVVEYKPLLDKAIELANYKPAACLIKQREQHTCQLIPGRDRDWDEAIANANAHECVPVAATDPLYILYTSGTTGQPKGVVRDNGGHAVALKWTMRNIYGVNPGEVYWAASDIGWAVGHSYLVYAPLFNGNTTILFEGKPVGSPDAGVFWHIIAEHGVCTLFTAPTAFRAIKKEDPDGRLVSQYNMAKFRALFLAGERTDPNTLNWAEQKLGVPVIDHWWQTETGWPICANPLGIEKFPVKPGSSTRPVPGWDVKVMDETGNPAATNHIGALVAKLPLPPGSFPTLWNAEQRFRDTYLEEYPGYYKTADAGYIDDDGYVYVMARTDDAINVAGHRLTTGAIEEIIAGHADVAECAVVGVADDLKGQLPVGFLVLYAGVERDADEISSEVVQKVRDEIGPIAAFKTALVVSQLPKTRSGKVLRGTIRKIADGESWKMPATIDNPAILDEITAMLKKVGYT